MLSNAYDPQINEQILMCRMHVAVVPGSPLWCRLVVEDYKDVETALISRDPDAMGVYQTPEGRQYVAWLGGEYLRATKATTY